MKATKIVLIASAILFSGCAVKKVPQPTSGSKADGTVELSYQYGQFEQPQVNWNQAKKKALKRCKAWGYGGVEAFGGVTEECQAFDSYGSCVRQFVTKTYQCLDSQQEEGKE